ncbi:MAG: phage virion morphogenesis protein [Planctomycetaceae bacterium]|nr:phage virion morphogenesis protein [Planctomycetaceae bacterium]
MPKTIDIEDLGDFLDGIVEVARQPSAEEAMQATLGELKADLAQGFQSSTAPDGTPWAPLKHPRPKGHNQDNKPLIDTGRLQESVLYNGDEHHEEISNGGLVMISEVEYGRFHQEGTRKFPARPFMGFSEKVLDTAADLTADSVANQIDNL